MIKLIVLIFLSLFLILVPNTQGQVTSNYSMNTLFLNKEQALLLPIFNTSSILNSSIDKIVISLYVLNINSVTPEVNFTINLFDPQTKQIDDGVSVFKNPQKDVYIDFELPRELFEKIVGTDKIFLLKIVNPSADITFAGVNSIAGMDPVLVIVHSEKLPHKEPGSSVVKNYNFALFSIIQSSYGHGNNIINTITQDENIWWKIVPIILAILSIPWWPNIWGWLTSFFK